MTIFNQSKFRSMKFQNVILICFTLLQLTMPVNARDDLIINKEASVLKNFGSRSGEGTCTGAVWIVTPIPKTIRNSCVSLENKLMKADRHCAAASDKFGCISSVTSEKTEDLISYMSCCVALKNSGK